MRQNGKHVQYIIMSLLLDPLLLKAFIILSIHLANLFVKILLKIL